MSAVHKYFTQQQLFVALDARNTCFSISDAIEPERHCLYPENGAGIAAALGHLDAATR